MLVTIHLWSCTRLVVRMATLCTRLRLPFRSLMPQLNDTIPNDCQAAAA